MWAILSDIDKHSVRNIRELESRRENKIQSTDRSHFLPNKRKKKGKVIYHCHGSRKKL